MSTSESLEAQKRAILKLIDASLGTFADLGGEVFSSGLNALKKGDLYVMGLNPGGGDAYPSIREHVLNWKWDRYSAFTDQCWNSTCWNRDCYGTQEIVHCGCERGTEQTQRNQRRVIERTLEAIGSPEADVASVFATNAIFAKSKKADTFQSETGWSLEDAWRKCSPLHKYFLSIVRPKVIVCFGYGRYDTAYSMAQSLCESVSEEHVYRQPEWKIDNFRWITECLNFNGEREPVLIVAVRHPSYGSAGVEAEAYLELIGTYVGQRT
jgi:hypothetical protein